MTIEAKDREIAERDHQFLILACIGGGAIILLLLGGGWCLQRIYQRALQAELLLKSDLEDQVWMQQKEIEYLRDWRQRILISTYNIINIAGIIHAADLAELRNKNLPLKNW